MDCIEKPLQNFFEKMGKSVGSNPWWFLITPLIVSAALGSGFYFIQDRISNNIEEEFTPFNGPAKTERKYFSEMFPEDDSMFSSLRQTTDGNYATLIVTNETNILTVEMLQEILILDSKIKNMLVEFDKQSFKYEGICAKVIEKCTSNTILDIIQYDAKNIETVTLTFPWYHTGNTSLPLYTSLGGVPTQRDTSVVKSAKAIQLYYYLKEGNKTKNDLWLESFISLVSNSSSPSLQVRTHILCLTYYPPAW